MARAKTALQYTIVAGPNGVGKSLYSTQLGPSDALVHDPDKEIAKILAKYPDLPDGRLHEIALESYEEFERSGMASGRHLTVETNLREDYLISRALHFRSLGYTINLVYLFLPNIFASMDRVNLRVKKKGHFVNWENVQLNFTRGPVNLVAHADKFDRVLLSMPALEWGTIQVPELLLTVVDGKVIQRIFSDVPLIDGIVAEVANAFDGEDALLGGMV